VDVTPDKVHALHQACFPTMYMMCIYVTMSVLLPDAMHYLSGGMGAMMDSSNPGGLQTSLDLFQ